MEVNEKRSITLTNRTNYFNPSTTKTKVTFGSPKSYQSRRIKIEGYESRLYWQYRYCEDHNGQTFFYTLTYNDKSMPKYNDINCFDYEDLRDLLTGGFRKQLLRKYGTTFKYFIGAELGDGKGSRGMHNNPHYHILFFLESANNERFPYVKISPEDFRHLVRLYWQGFDEDIDGYHSYKDAKYGIAREGDNIGKVKDYRACMYCAKYVCKDAKLVESESEIARKERLRLKSIYTKPFIDEHGIECSYFADLLYHDFYVDILKPMYKSYFEDHVDCRGRMHKAKKDSELLKMLVPECNLTFVYDEKPEIANWYKVISEVIRRYSFWEEFADYRRSYIEPMVKECINEWRNRYSNKVRISQGVGDYALDGIDKLSPSIQVPSKKGFKNRPISMYYYRKLYMDVVKDEKNQNIYILNDDGREYKLYNLSKRINKMINKNEGYIDLLINNSELYDIMKNSDTNITNFMDYVDFLKNYNYLLSENNLQNILRRYGEYKLVYENRYFQVNGDADNRDDIIPDINVYDDYDRFLTPAYYSVSYDASALLEFLNSPHEDWLSYCEHPYFHKYLGIFGVLDMCTDYFFVTKDDKDQREAEERSAVKRFHNITKLKEFYSRFEN